MDSIIENRAEALLDYLYAVIKMGQKIHTKIDEHGDFVLYMDELPDHEGIQLLNISEDNETWLKVFRQNIQASPDVPNKLEGWVEVSEDPRQPPTKADECQIRDECIAFDADEQRVAAWDAYINQWNEWAERMRPQYIVQDLFMRLFNLRERLKYDEELELVWGHGIVLWKQDAHDIKYPLIIQKMILDYDPINGVMSIIPDEDADPRLETDIFTDMNIPDLSPVREHFEQIDYNPADSGTYLDILKEAGGVISADFCIYNAEEIQDHVASKRLCIVDESVLFVRRRQVDSLLRDIDGLKNALTEDKLVQAGAWKAILGVSADKPSVYEQRERDEWSCLIDKNILFPLPANLEQIQIIDRLEHAEGVVVWGPPGTGKSHTIANLICHFMAQGKKVLVTSQKEQALTVLHNKIPEALRPLCISVLSHANDSKEQLNKAVSTIIEMVTQSDVNILQADIKRLEEQIDQDKEEMILVQHQMQKLAGIQVKMVQSDDGRLLLPSDIAKVLKLQEDMHNWLDDMPAYEVIPVAESGKEAVKIVSRPPLDGEEMKRFREFRRAIIDHIDDLSYEFPDTKDLLDRVSFGKMLEYLHKLSAMDADVDGYIPGVVFTDESADGIEAALNAVKAAMDVYSRIDADWQKTLLDIMRKSQLDRGKILKSAQLLQQHMRNLEDLYSKLNLLDNVTWDRSIPLEETAQFINEALNNVRNGRKAVGLLELNMKKKRVLKGVLVNGRIPCSEGEWESANSFIRLIVAVKEASDAWNNFAANSGIVEPDNRQDIGIQDVKPVMETIRRLLDVVDYDSAYIPEAKQCLDAIVKSIGPVSDERLEDLYKALSIKMAQQQYSAAVSDLKRQKDVLRQVINKGRAHAVVADMLNCLDRAYECDDKTVEIWGDGYQFIKLMESLKDDYNRFMAFWQRLNAKAPKWAKRWLQKDVDENNLCPAYWMTSWGNNAIKHYLYDINFENRKMKDLEDKQEQLIKALRNDKEQLILNKTTLGLMLGTPEESLKALERWHLAVRKLGKGTGKLAWRKKQMVQREMLQAKDAVPVWIMPVYKVSETLPSDFANFDVVIVDEASQCDIKSLLALARGKKVIIVGDPEQISPDAVGKSVIDVQRLMQQYLSDISIKDYMDLTTSLFDIAKITFAGQGMLMLREHFRCMPEIIGFSNRLCYNGRIIPLRNVLPGKRLEPVLADVYVSGGYREDTQDINKPEADVICERLCEMVHDPRYKGKTFGVISLTGKAQAKYIWDKINDYLTPEEQEACSLRMGDAYAFQGDERDVMILSMVVGANDAKRLVALTKDQYRQRFNVAVSRARDQLILFHSVELEDLKETDLRYELLSYVQNGIWSQQSAERARDLLESPFEEAVYDWLTARNYKVTPQVKVGNYRIDMVVEGEYNRLAVECDGDRWHTPDRWWQDRLRQRQMERTGWVFWRVWGSEFYQDPNAAMSTIIPLLDRLGIKPADQWQSAEAYESYQDTVSQISGLSDQSMEFRYAILHVLKNSTKGEDLLPDEVLRAMNVDKRGIERQRIKNEIKQEIERLKADGMIEEYRTQKRKRLKLTDAIAAMVNEA